MKKLNLTLISTFIALLGSFLWHSCGPSTSQESTTASTNNAFSEAKQQLTEEVDKVIHELPPPSTLPITLKEANIDYLSGVINSMNQLDKYLLSTQKAALNLGIYATDVGYLAIYSRVSEAKKYMEGCQKIIDEIGVSTAFGENLTRRFQDSANNADSLIAIINEAMIRVEEQLENLDELQLASLALSGSFVEGIYIASTIIDILNKQDIAVEMKSQRTKTIINIILSQKNSLIDLTSVLKHIERDASIEQLIDHMSRLRGRYGDLQEYLDETEKAGKFIDLQSAPIQGLISDIRSIRSEITTP